MRKCVEDKMLRILSEWTVEQLIARDVINRDRKPVYIYGCELLLSTACSVCCILFIGLLTGRFVQAVVFLLSFMPIRTVGSGYHASSYRNCFLLSNAIAFACIAAAEMGSRYIPVWLVWCAFLLSQCLIWFRGPFQSRIHPLKRELVERNRGYMHRIQGIEIVLAALFSIAGKRNILDTVVLATMAVAIMIYIAEKEERKNVDDAGRAD